MAMIKCPTCGKLVSDSNSYCSYCDALLDKKVKCPRCGSDNVELLIKVNENKGCLDYIMYYLLGIPGIIIGRIVTGKKGFSGEVTNMKHVCKNCNKKFTRKE